MLDLTHKPDRPLISPSILSADFGAMADDCRQVLEAPADVRVSMLHVDVMDGHFAGNLTMGADMIRGVRRHFSDVLIDTHLMVDRPGDYITSFAEAGANHYSFHIEVCHPFHPNGVDADELIQRIIAAGMTAGLVINPLTPIAPLQPYLDRLTMVLVMSVVPGRSGQTFMPEVLPKVKALRDGGFGGRIEMDGGIGPDTIGRCVEAGADTFVAASAIFGQSDRAAALRALREAAG